MNILFLEDRGSVSFYVTEALAGEEHVVFEAFSIPDALYILEKQSIDCIIADLNMSPEGLSPQEIEETQDGLLTGWLFLKNHVFSQYELRSRTIIYSEYLDALRKSVSPVELAGIKLLAKQGSVSPVKGLLESVERIAATDQRK